MLTIAITGGIGSGKTQVTNYLSEKGYTVLDADVIAREITAAGGKAITDIIEIFGPEYIREDGSMNRDRMRALVYDNPEAKRKLEECTTRVVQKDIEAAISFNRACGMAVTFVAVPLLFECGGGDEYDATWLVVADEQIRIRRVMARDGLDEITVKKIIKNQFSDKKKLALASDVLYNNDCVQELRNQIDKLLTKYKI